MSKVDINLDPVYEALGGKLEEVSDVIIEKVLEATPVRTGNLKRSTHLDIDRESLEAHIRADADYASYVEYRTGYMSNAIEESIPEVKKLWR